jgi:hypothetical protein
VEEDLEDAGQKRNRSYPGPGIRIGPPRVGLGGRFPSCTSGCSPLT